jgi:hypothetical protein
MKVVAEEVTKNAVVKEAMEAGFGHWKETQTQTTNKKRQKNPTVEDFLEQCLVHPPRLVGVEPNTFKSWPRLLSAAQ